MTTSVFDVRTARTSDAEAVSEVHDAAWREAYQGMIEGRALERMIAERGPRYWQETIARTTVLVLQAEGQVVGYASLGVARQGGQENLIGLVSELYLRPEYQGVGLGRRLFRAALDAFRQRGHKRCVLRALANNERARGFYEALGGKRLGHASDRFGSANLPVVWYGWSL